MRRIYLILFLIVIALSGCRKNDGPALSGTETINNLLNDTQPYYAMGFSFVTAKKVSTLTSPVDVITINAYTGNFNKTYFDAQNFGNSFYKYGVYADAATASAAFKNLTDFNMPAWKATGDSVKTNQIWLFKTSIDTFAKFLITNSVGETRNNIPFVECTFEWVYQPDGSLTFSGK